MTAAELLAHLDALGVQVRFAPETGKLKVRPEALIPPDLRQQILDQAHELIALVATRPSPVWTDPAPVSGGDVPLTDPRPDLGGSAEWNWLLATAAITLSDTFAATLHGFRCLGALLTHDRGGWRLVPLLDASERRSLWHNRESYERDREKWLMPYRNRRVRRGGAL